ncbi:MAG: Dabb family protein [Pseudomonadales bacterium]
MIKHIVMWRLHNEAEGNDKTTNARIAKEKLQALNGVIPGLINLEVGNDFSNGEMSCDLVLYSELESKEALKAYQQHPAHVEVAKFVVSICAERWVVDYEV